MNESLLCSDTKNINVLLCLSLTGPRVWDVANELVGLCAMAPPDNPFSLTTSKPFLSQSAYLQLEHSLTSWR